ncbi:uncharacterized protein [Haliotis asinina]|uniref:uncharacterized protein n=1 Tax=Haliotis asinina TaxID=109174 RepID=UPI00353257BA
MNTPVDLNTRPLSAESMESEIDIEFQMDFGEDTQPSAAQGDVIDENLLEEESFMTLTQKEQLAWEEMIQKLKHELEQRGKNFSEWADKITRRRMYAYARMKKLEKYQQAREGFYRDIDGFIETFHGDALRSSDEMETAVEKRDSQIQLGGGDGSGHGVKDGVDLGLKKESSTPRITQEPPVSVT